MKCKINKCSFCSMHNLEYDATTQAKQKEMLKLFSSYTKNIKPFVGMENPFNYRHKVIASFQQIKGKLVAGIYEEGTHNLLRIDDCHIQDQRANEIIKDIVKLANDFKLEAYNEDTKRGLLRHVLIRTAHYTNEILVTLVVGHKVFKSKKNFIKELVKVHPEITTVICNYNPRSTSVVLGDIEEVSYGPGFIFDSLLGLKFSISSKSFYQVNPIQTEKLYQSAIDAAQISADDTVLDTYSGIGTISLLASKSAKDVIGVEINSAAVQDANKNRRINRINNCRFVLSDATKYMLTTKDHFDILIMDPTRNGSTIEFLRAAIHLKPKKIIYVSCNPETQIRDLKTLVKYYKVESAQGFDMFPFTKHIESVVVLTRI